ncbi:MAG: endolytic transglycosylase MltG [Oscillospiraceae bacterium]|nr:endolytic transglycosylase MltG [Oscillospiraceae bacterium]
MAYNPEENKNLPGNNPAGQGIPAQPHPDDGATRRIPTPPLSGDAAQGRSARPSPDDGATRRIPTQSRPGGSSAQKKSPQTQPGDSPTQVRPSKPRAGRTSEFAAELDTGDKDFKVNFDFDGKYKDVPDRDRPIRQRRERRTGCLGGMLYAAFVICISLLLASLAWMAATDVLGLSTTDEQIRVDVPHDFTLEYITDMLHEHGLIRYRALFRLYAGFSDAMDRITPGAYYLNKNFDYRALVQGMTPRAGVRAEVMVVIPEGFTLAQIFRTLDYHGVAAEEDLWYAATNHPFRHWFLNDENHPHPPVGDPLRLEGFLFPDTYNFFINEAPIQAINRMLNQFSRRFNEDYRYRAAELNMSIRDIINIAAMVERETGSNEESPRIASVIYNRLASPNFPFLDIDATIVYAIQGTDIPFSVNLDHPFNTRNNPGLPPGPIANPGMASIRAALFPANTPYYFYALNLQGTHNFFRNYDQHRAFVQSDQFGGSAV